MNENSILSDAALVEQAESLHLEVERLLRDEGLFALAEAASWLPFAAR